MQWFLSLLTGPVINGAITAYKAKLESGNTSDKIAADLAGRELDVQRREIEVEAETKRALIGHWYEPTNLFGYIMVVYFGKVIVWDKVLASVTGGSTDPITGDLATWAGMIMLFFVGKRGIENVTRILARR
jgi:hypothetical protein